MFELLWQPHQVLCQAGCPMRYRSVDITSGQFCNFKIQGKSKGMVMPEKDGLGKGELVEKLQGGHCKYVPKYPW